MLKSTSTTPTDDPISESAHRSLGIVAGETMPHAAVSVGNQAIISKGLMLNGEITGSESLFIDGKVEGSINLPDSRVTVGRNGQVNASINAREIVVLGKIRGNISASDRVDIRSEGAVTGDVAAARISIEDGAFFKGGIDIRKPVAKTSSPSVTETLKQA